MSEWSFIGIVMEGLVLRGGFSRNFLDVQICWLEMLQAPYTYSADPVKCVLYTLTLSIFDIPDLPQAVLISNSHERPRLGVPVPCRGR
jgi:hypothetical protein